MSARSIQVVGRTIDRHGRGVAGIGLALVHGTQASERKTLGEAGLRLQRRLRHERGAPPDAGTGFRLQVSTNREPIDADAARDLPEDADLGATRDRGGEATRRSTTAPRNPLLLHEQEMIGLWKR